MVFITSTRFRRSLFQLTVGEGQASKKKVLDQVQLNAEQANGTQYSA